MAARQKTDAYVKNVEQNGNSREKEALEYIKKHRIMELFDNFTAMLLYNRPAEPRAFLMENLQKLIKSRSVNLDPPSHFDKSNVDAVFGMMDPTKRGVITREQYNAGMTCLGITKFEKNPPGSEMDKIAMDTFGREARKGIAMEAATYLQKEKSSSREM